MTIAIQLLDGKHPAEPAPEELMRLLNEIHLARAGSTQ